MSLAPGLEEHRLVILTSPPYDFQVTFDTTSQRVAIQGQDPAGGDVDVVFSGSLELRALSAALLHAAEHLDSPVQQSDSISSAENMERAREALVDKLATAIRENQSDNWTAADIYGRESERSEGQRSASKPVSKKTRKTSPKVVLTLKKTSSRKRA